MYGLQLRDKKPSQQTKPKPRIPAAFGDDDDGDNVEQEIYRQADKNKSLKHVEDMHKKTLEEDPLAFEYDGLYDIDKQKAALPVSQDKQQRKSKYIENIIEKAKQREREQEVVYERKLAKERDQDAHLFADKDKFVTSAYKRKLAEQAKWAEEEHLRELREARDDVTNKKDLTEFYVALHKNVAFGGGEAGLSKSKKQHDRTVSRPYVEDKVVKQHERSISSSPSERSPVTDKVAKQHEHSVSPSPNERSRVADLAPVSGEAFQPAAAEQPTEAEQQKKDHHKRSYDAIEAAKQRLLDRKKAKAQVVS